MLRPIVGKSDLHEDFSRKEEVQQSSDRSFGIVFFVAFAIIGAWPLLSDAPVRIWSLGISGGFLLIALIYPRLLAPLNFVWGKFGLLLHRIVSPIVLGLMFFCSILPMSLLLRLLRKDLLRLRWEPQAPTYWIEKTPPGPPPEGMRNQF